MVADEPNTHTYSRIEGPRMRNQLLRRLCLAWPAQCTAASPFTLACMHVEVVTTIAL